MTSESYLLRLSRRGLKLADEMERDGAGDNEITKVLREVSSELNQLAAEHAQLQKDNIRLAGERLDKITQDIVRRPVPRDQVRSARTLPLQIGSRLWRVKRVRYNRGRTWEEVEIVGETHVSWLINLPGCVADAWNTQKIAKRRMPADLVRTREQADQYDWVRECGYRIGERVGRCDDYGLLKQIDTLIAAYEECERAKLKPALPPKKR